MKGIFLIVVMCLTNVAVSAQPQVSTSAKSPNSKEVRLVNPESIFLLRCFLDKDNALSIDAVSDITSKLFGTAKSKEEYFKDFTSIVTPYGSGDYVHPSDVRDLSESLLAYAERSSKRKEYHDTFIADSGIVQSNSANAIKVAIDVLIAPTYLTPPHFIKLSDGLAPTLGVDSYLHIVSPIAPAIAKLVYTLDTCETTETTILTQAKARAKKIRQIIRDYAKKQLMVRKKEGFIGTKAENNDTRAYAKLFEEELPILRQQLTLLKGDIDKGFAELQKQQDAKEKTDEVATADKAATTK